METPAQPTDFALDPDRNCWRVGRAERGAFLVGGAAYFAAFRRAVLAARRFVHVLAWDINGGIDLVRDPGHDDGYPHRLADFLYAALDANPDLEIRILLWDYSMVYIAEREWLPLARWRRDPHPRLRLEKDSALNLGASHHQKIVVVDDRLAFSGGLDLSTWRWDTAEHPARDERRKDPKGEPYQPYHDVQLLVEGPVARDFGDLCARRWQRAVGEPLPRAAEGENGDGNALWPEDVAPDFARRELGLSLTFSEYDSYPAVRQVERLHLDLIASARRRIYIENQYLSSHRLVRALAERLREADGPEVAIVLTRDTGGVLEEGTMGVLRNRLLEILAAADAGGRFNAYYPYVEDADGHGSQVYVHAKVVIVDGRVMKVGSANLSNRSMRVDSEIDVVFGEADGDGLAETFLHRLLGMHFGCGPGEAAAALAETGGIHAAIRKLRPGRRHRLEPLDYGCGNELQRRVADTQILDPDEPIDPGYWLNKAVEEGYQPLPKWRRYFQWGVALSLGVLLAYVVREVWGGFLAGDRLFLFLEALRGEPRFLLAFFALFAGAGLVGLPLNLLLVAGTIVFGPLATLACGFGGSLLSAGIAFWAGHRFGRPLIRRLGRKQVDALCHKVSERGFWSVVLVRLIPVAPFCVINLVAGFANMPFRTFIAGTAAGMGPGMGAVVLLTHQVRDVVARPGPGNWLGLVVALLLLGCAAWYLRKVFRR